ncbi:MAG: L-threonylcarbamoyladenylate synthase [Syntrophales bacterium]|nr:L-threonylcarbamoyladenylate synthase [Syntrophales bacterium]
MNTPRILNINPSVPETEFIAEAVAVLRQGGVVAYPTETFYGLGADMGNAKAIERIFQIKGRGFDKPIALIGASMEDVVRITDDIPPAAASLIATHWPGPLTILFAASTLVSPRLTAGTGKIGIRISSHPVAHALAAALGGPLTATSANISGGLECTSIEEVLQQLKDTCDLYIDSGTTPGGLGSTIVDVTVDPPRLIRRGLIDISESCS